MEARLIEEEVAKRVEEMVAKRVEQELERRKDDIEAEVLRRVEEAKRIMEAAMLEEMEQKKQQELEAQQAKEVRGGSIFSQAYSTQKTCAWGRELISIDYLFYLLYPDGKSRILRKVN